ncbi:hypothetical protein TAMYLO_580034 [Tenacibaculum amylolyticum]
MISLCSFLCITLPSSRIDFFILIKILIEVSFFVENKRVADSVLLFSFLNLKIDYE